MIRFAVGILLAAVVSSSSPVEQSVDTTPLGMVGSGLQLEQTICLELSRELGADWPVFEAIYSWNKNNKNILTTDLQGDCDGVVLITQTDSKLWWGSTEFYPRDIIHVQLSSFTPVARHRAVICHELGHVLGLPHSLGDGSCMDPNQNNPLPTELNIQAVGDEPWSAAVAQRSMLGVK